MSEGWSIARLLIGFGLVIASLVALSAGQLLGFVLMPVGLLELARSQPDRRVNELWYLGLLLVPFLVAARRGHLITAGFALLLQLSGVGWPIAIALVGLRTVQAAPPEVSVRKSPW